MDTEDMEDENLKVHLGSSTNGSKSLGEVNALIERVENRMGMGHRAWDMVRPEELVRAVLTEAAVPELLSALKSATESLQQLVDIGRIPANNKGLREARAALVAHGCKWPNCLCAGCEVDWCEASQ